MPSPYAIPAGCRFHTRCPFAEDVCREVDPPAVALDSERGGHVAACHVLPQLERAPEAVVGDDPG